MITKKQAMDTYVGTEIHENNCTCTIGPRGGIKKRIIRWRVSGKCKTWKRDPNRWKLPIKHGLFYSSYIGSANEGLDPKGFHLASKCPLDIDPLKD